jgi:hypothetical protein
LHFAFCTLVSQSLNLLPYQENNKQQYHMSFSGVQPFLQSVAKGVGGSAIKSQHESASASRMNQLVYDATKAHLDVVHRIATTGGGKTIQKDHVRLAEEVARMVRGKQAGGAETVLPSEYFGRNSGSYFGSANARAGEHSALGGETLARGALPASGSFLEMASHSGGGAACGARSQRARRKACYGTGSGKSKRGGAETVLPSEYFGSNSGRYFAHDAIAGMEHSTAGIPQQVARQELPQGMAGGGSGARGAKMSDELFRNAVREYRRRNVSAGDMRISEDAKVLLRTAIAKSIERAVTTSHAQCKANTLTPACIDRASRSIFVFP